MRKNQIKGLIHDLLNLGDWNNPLDKNMNEEKIEINLLTNEIFGTDNDFIIDFFREKIKWFQERIKELRGVDDFQKANIYLIGNKEKVEIVFKNENFKGDVVWGGHLEEIKKGFEKK